MGCYSIRGKNPEITLVVTYLVFYILKRQGLLLQLPIGMLLHQRKKTPWDNPGRYLSCILYLENNRIIIAISGWDVYTIGE